MIRSLGKQRISQTGRQTGGSIHSRGALYRILQNRLYLGEIEHKEQIYPGEHEGILSRELWERVQEQLRTNNHAHRNGLRASVPSLLIGLIFDEQGNRFTPAHAVKNGKRYRYYVSQIAIKNPGSPHLGTVRIPANEIERLVLFKLQSFLATQATVLDAISSKKESAAATKTLLAVAKNWSKQLACGVNGETRCFVRAVISRVVIQSDAMELFLDKRTLRDALFGTRSPSTSGGLTGWVNLRIQGKIDKCAREMRLVLPPNNNGELPSHHVPSLIKAVVRAHDWYDRILRGEFSSIYTIAKSTGLNERYVSRIFQCAFLALDIVESILNGNQPARMTLEDLRSNLPLEWTSQRQLLSFQGD